MVLSAEPMLTHLRRGALEYCVLSLLVDQERYGLELARELTRGEVLMSSEGTLYPLLARLRRAGWVDTRWSESTEGPPRRYYSITAPGKDVLASFRPAWITFRDAVDDALRTHGGAA